MNRKPSCPGPASLSRGNSPWERLNALLSSCQREILLREENNDRFIYMYDIGSWWSAFEQSAFLLQKIFPDSDMTVLHLKTFPFPVVMVSVPENLFSSLGRLDAGIVRGPEYPDCRVLSVSGISCFMEGGNPVSGFCFPVEDYSRWHNDAVDGLI